MFTLQHISKSFIDTVVLDDVSLSVAYGEVVALIGENGAGKTTLLKLILGQLDPDGGTVLLHNETVGYIPQEAEPIGTIESSFDARTEEWERVYALGLAGLDTMPEARTVADLSGGQKTRLAFAKVLAGRPEPTVLLLDEPTNNLDAEGLAWLEQFIKNYRGSIVLVSHDRAFINAVATSIVELHSGKLKQYGGNYEFYMQQKETEYQTALQNYQENVGKRKQLEKAIRSQIDKGQHIHKNIKHVDNSKAQRDFFRNRLTVKFGQTTKRLQSRLGQLGEAEKPHVSKAYEVKLSGDILPAKFVLRTSKLTKRYGDILLSYPDIEIRGSERLHLRGNNGSGKSTLLKMIAGIIEPTSGEVRLGQGVNYGYFSQDVSGLDYTISSLENLRLTGADMAVIHREAQSLGLGENDLSNKPDALSRGQQAKLGFAKLLLMQNQLLILDEPTNHLDIPTRERIEIALQRYRGAMIIASHDTYFLDTFDMTQLVVA